MPCDTVRLRPNQTLADRNAEIKSALKRLEQRLQAGQVRVVVDRASGAAGFAGWGKEERASITDVCAYRVLAAENSWALRQAVARAEAQAGRKVNPVAVAAGVHSHDDGRSWGPGH